VSFGVGRLRAPSWLMAAGAIALFVFVFFFHWFGGGVSGLSRGSQISGVNVSATGWEAFTSSRWIWLATIVLALGSALATAVDYRFDGPLRPAALSAIFGALSCALIVYRIAHHPSATVDIGHLHASYGIKLGIWLGLLAAIVVTVGGCLQALAEARPAVESPMIAGQAFSGLTVSSPESPSNARHSDDAP
jgi:hypothetical protein